MTMLKFVTTLSRPMNLFSDSILASTCFSSAKPASHPSRGSLEKLELTTVLGTYAYRKSCLENAVKKVNKDFVSISGDALGCVGAATLPNGDASAAASAVDSCVTVSLDATSASAHASFLGSNSCKLN